MRLFGRARPKRSSVDDPLLKDRLANSELRRQLIVRAADGDQHALKAAALLGGSGRRGAAFVPTESLGDKVIEQLVLQNLNKPAEDPLDRLWKLKQMAIEERELRRELEGDEEDDDSPMAQLARIAAAVAPALVAVLNPQAAASVAAALHPTGAPPLPAPASSPEVALPTSGEPRVSSSPPVAATPQADSTASDGDMPAVIGFQQRYVLSKLQQLPPAAFAAWLRTQSAAQPIVDGLSQYTDAQIPGVLEQAAQSPELAPWAAVFAWLRAHLDYTLAVVHALRGDVDDGADADDVAL